MKLSFAQTAARACRQYPKSVIASAAAGPGRRLETNTTYSFEFIISFTIAFPGGDCSDTTAQEASANATLASLDGSLTNLTGADIAAGISNAIAALPAEDLALVNANGYTVTVTVDDLGLPPVVTITPDPGFPGFDLLGGGECKDASGNSYVYFEYDFPNTADTRVEFIKTCTEVCTASACLTENPDWILRGLEYEYNPNLDDDGISSSHCYCAFEGFVTGNTCTEADDVSYESNTGTGEVVASEGGTTSYYCLAYNP